MATAAQLQANRRNAHKSTGPTSTEGKATSRFNALKSGLHAQSRVIPGEDAAELEALAANYRQEFQPETPSQMFLVDTITGAEWQLRRLHKIEAQLWERELAGGDDFAGAYSRNPLLAQVQRRIEAMERTYDRAYKQLQQILEARERERKAIERAAENEKRIKRIYAYADEARTQRLAHEAELRRLSRGEAEDDRQSAQKEGVPAKS